MWGCIGLSARYCGLVGMSGIKYVLYRLTVDPEPTVLRDVHLHRLICYSRLFFTLGSIDNSSSSLNTPALHQARVQNCLCARLMAPVVQKSTAVFIQEASIEALEGVL